MRRLLAQLLIVALIAILVPRVTAQPQAPAQPPATTAVVVRVSYADQADLQRLANEYDVWEVRPKEHVVLIQIEDLAQADRFRDDGRTVVVDEQRTAELRNLPETFRSGYKTNVELYAHMQALATAHPELTQMIDYGDSWDKVMPGGNAGFDLYALRITNEAIGGTKPVFFVMANIHAREIATPEIAWRLAERYVNGYGVDADVTWVLDHTTLYVVYMVNPDGHLKVEQNVDWRKNTDNDDGCGSTYGTDLNRNSDFQWGGLGASTNPCNETYRGPSAASEPEVTALQNFLVSVFPDQRPDDLVTPAPITSTGVFVTLHSYAEDLIPVWSYNFSASPNHAQIMQLERKWAAQSNYTPCNPPDAGSCSVSYAASGVTEDFVYGRLGVPGYTFEVGTSFYPTYSTITTTIIRPNLIMLGYGAKVAPGPYWLPAGPDVLSVLSAPNPVTAGQPVTFTAVVSDTQNGNQNITAAEYFVVRPGDPAFVIPAPGSATPMTAIDGNFNSPVEGVRAVYNTTGAMTGAYLVVVRGRDAGNNWGRLAQRVQPQSHADARPLADEHAGAQRHTHGDGLRIRQHRLCLRHVDGQRHRRRHDQHRQRLRRLRHDDHAALRLHVLQQRAHDHRVRGLEWQADVHQQHLRLQQRLPPGRLPEQSDRAAVGRPAHRRAIRLFR
jgi:carboxypeptidase T